MELPDRWHHRAGTDPDPTRRHQTHRLQPRSSLDTRAAPRRRRAYDGPNARPVGCGFRHAGAPGRDHRDRQGVLRGARVSRPRPSIHERTDHQLGAGGKHPVRRDLPRRRQCRRGREAARRSRADRSDPHMELPDRWHHRSGTASRSHSRTSNASTSADDERRISWLDRRRVARHPTIRIERGSPHRLSQPEELPTVCRRDLESPPAGSLA